MKTKITNFLLVLLFPIFTYATSGIWDRAIALNAGVTNFVTGSNFNNQNLGIFLNTTNYQLKGGSINTFKNGSDDITGARMFYRVIQVGDTNSLSFTSINLPFSLNLPNPGDQQWANSSDSINFMEGLPVGNYYLEVYFEADFTFNGGSGVHIDNNNGANYKAQFTITQPNTNCFVNLGNDTTICGLAAVELGGNIELSPFGDSLTIIFNASNGGAGQLIGANEVYFHSTYEAVSFGGPVSPWVGNWGVDDGIGKMDSLGNNLWKITISPYSYYNIPANGTINGIFMAFRNADGSLQENNNSNNIFLLYNSSPSSSFSGVTATRSLADFSSIVWSTGATSPSILVSESGTYSVQLTNSQGCIAMDTIVVNASSIPFVNISGSTIICSGNSTTLTATPGFNSYLWSNGATTSSLNVTAAGNYILTVTDSIGCSGIDVVDVIELSIPDANFTFTNANANFTFTVSNTYPNAQYLWDFNGDGVNDNVTNPSNPTRGFSANGTYNVRLIVVNQCGSDTIIKPVLVNGIGIVEIKSNFKQLSVFPNPSSGSISIEMPDELINQNSTFSLADLSGKKILDQNQKISNQLFQLDLNSISNGIYLLTIKSDQQNYFSKIIINH